MEGAPGQLDLDWTPIGLLADHEVLVRPTTHEPLGFGRHKEGLLWVRLGKPRALMDATALDHEQKVTASNPLICVSRVKQSRLVTFPHARPAKTTETYLGCLEVMAGSVESRLRVTRQQILAFRRRVGALDERMPMGSQSLRRAAWAGLQDSMPRAALLSLHARVDGVEPSTWKHPSLAQLWGPRYSTYVVAKRDFALFSLGRLPDNAKSRLRAERMAERLHAHLDGRRMTDREVARVLGVGYALRYAATTGTVAIRWEGARAPTVWTVAAAEVDPADACRKLAQRYLHIFGPATADGFARWAGISRRSATDAFASLEASLLPVRSPLGDEWLLAEDEPAIRAGETVAAPARLLPSGDAYFLLDGAARELLVPREDQRQRLWTPRVWPGALLVEGEIGGTWRRAHHTVRIDAWARLSRGTRAAIEAEANALPLPGVERAIGVVWNA
jgi:hypothetical protein